MSEETQTVFVAVHTQPHTFKAVPTESLTGVLVEKSKQKYISFVKVNQKGAGKLYGELMKWQQTPLNGVTLQEAYQVFGKWDFAFLFWADTNENALHFAGDVVRPVEGVVATRTIPMAPLKNWSQP